MALYLSTRRFVDLFLHTSFSITFRHWTKSFWTFEGNFAIRDFETEFFVSWFFSDFFPGILYSSSFVSVFWLWTVRSFSRRFPESSIKRHSVCPEQQFEEDGFSKFLFSLYHFRTFIKRNFGCFAKSSREFPKLPFRCPEEPLVWLGFFWLFVFYSLPFGIWAKKTGVLLEGLRLRPRCQNCVPCV